MDNPVRLMIVGDSPTMLEEISNFQHDGDVMVINRAGFKYSGDIKHWASMHPECLISPDPIFGYKVTDNFVAERKERGYNMDFIIHAPTGIKGIVDRVWLFKRNDGGSAMFSIRVALELGYEKIVLAGISLYGDYERYQRTLIENYQLLKNKIRSLGGFPQELFGYPEDSWLSNKQGDK